MKLKITIRDDFWSPRIEKMCREIIPYQYEVLNDAVPGIPKSHAIENFRIAAGETDGEYQGMLFQDSDVAKWIEAAAYSLQIHPNEEVQKKIDGLIKLIGRAQQADGYLNTYYICKGVENRFTNIAHGHELYCAGHLVEAAVAYAETTGKEELLFIAERYVTCLMDMIGPEDGKLRIYSGHPEIELALYRLYCYTGNKKYYQFMNYLIMERGKQPSFLLQDKGFGEQYRDKWFHLKYHQAHEPVWEQKEAVGHCVRAVYLYCAMADLARESRETYMRESLERLWQDVTTKKMYITGAIGTQAHGECFSEGYDLPNDRAYAETCAAIGLIFWAKRMLLLEEKSEFADVMELALYNGALSGMSTDGKHYFYVNPLEVNPFDAVARYDMQHIKTEREAWMGCACCPPNIARLLTSLNQYIYFWSQETNRLYVNLYIGGRISFEHEGTYGCLEVTSEYVENGKISYFYKGSNEKFVLCLRIPGWAQSYQLSVNGKQQEKYPTENGYLCISREFVEGDCIKIEFPLALKKVYANPRVGVDAGRAALMRGPVVYCLEEADNGKNLSGISVGELKQSREFIDTSLPYHEVSVCFRGFRDREEDWKNKLYGYEESGKEEIIVKAIPYHLWGNRGVGEMKVWIRSRQDC